MKASLEHIKLLSKPIHAEVDHLAILHEMYEEYQGTAMPLSNLMKYYLDGLDDIPTKQEASLWNPKAFEAQRKPFYDRYFELLEILQNDYEAFPFNFEVIKSSALTPLKFQEYPIWSEYYDFDELAEIEQWGLNKEAIVKQLQAAEFENEHPYYTVPINQFPIDRMRYFTKAKFTTAKGTQIEGAIMNEGKLACWIFLEHESEVINNHPILREEKLKSLTHISKFYNIPISELNTLKFETLVPKKLNKRIKGTFEMNG